MLRKAQNFQDLDAILHDAESHVRRDPQKTLELSDEVIRFCAQAARGEAGAYGAVSPKREMTRDIRLSRALLLRSEANRILGNHREALDQADQAWLTFEKWSHLDGMAGVHAMRGSVYALLGHHANALESCREAIALFREAGNIQGETRALNELGLTYIEIGDHDRAIECFERAYDLSQQDPDINWMAYHALNHLGVVYHARKDYDTALDYYAQALAVEAPSEKASVAGCYTHIGEIRHIQGQFREAREYFERARQIAGDEKNCEIMINSLINLGKLFADPVYPESDTGTARRFLLEALGLAEKGRYHALLSRCNLALSEVHEAEGDTGRALEYFRAYHRIEQAGHNKDATRRIADLQIAHDLDKSRREAELFQQRNTQLAALNSKVEQQRKDVARMNRKLQQLVQEKSEFLSIAAHDLKSPLAVICGYAQLIQEDARDQDSEISEFANIIEITANRLSLLVLNLLDVNAIETGALKMKVQKLDLTLVVDEIAREFAEQAKKKDIEIRTDFPDSGSQFLGDHIAAEQVIRNLVSNALKFSPRGKSVTLRVIDLPEFARLEVRDEGPGLTKEDQRMLYQRFARLSAKPTGDEHSSGLGLYIVKQRVEAMRGRVWCDSKPGESAVFVIELPKQVEEEEPQDDYTE